MLQANRSAGRRAGTCCFKENSQITRHLIEIIQQLKAFKLMNGLEGQLFPLNTLEKHRCFSVSELLVFFEPLQEGFVFRAE